MRLRRPEEFRRVWSEGRSWAHPLFILWLASNEGNPSRIGIIASRKVGNAVVRNRARRLLREAARHLYRYIPDGWDVVLVARSSLGRVSESSVEMALKQMLVRVGAWSVELEKEESIG